jgi:HD-like signal output (HDOD) protein
MNEVDRIIMQHPMLAGTLIRYANSPLYRRGSEISNVPTATRLIGIKNIRSAVVMTTLRSSCASDNDLTQAILQHSLAVAALCKLIARKCCIGSADDLELLGLIHDIGMVVLATNVESDYRALMLRAQSENVALDVLEESVFGFNHDQIAARALQEFRLPKRHEMVLKHFHQAPQVGEFDEEMEKERAILSLAHRLLYDMVDEEPFHGTLIETTEELVALLRLDAATVSAIIAEATDCISHSAD